ncbi:MAG: c-type cytochrome [Methylovirgula sp.]
MKNLTFALACASALFAGQVAFAQSDNGLAPDIDAGKTRAEVCFACHGENGISQIPGVPNLAGQAHIYIERALHEYHDAQLRQDPTMTAMAKPLSDRDIVNIAAYFSLLPSMSDGRTEVQELKSFETELKAQPAAADTQPPVAAAAVAQAQPPAPARNGQQIFSTVCTMCHGTGLAGAPKFGDKNAWKPRIAQGIETLHDHALHGFKGMPPKGTCATCTDNEIKSAVDYMVGHSQ